MRTRAAGAKAALRKNPSNVFSFNMSSDNDANIPKPSKTEQQLRKNLDQYKAQKQRRKQEELRAKQAEQEKENARLSKKKRKLWNPDQAALKKRTRKRQTGAAAARQAAPTRGARARTRARKPAAGAKRQQKSAAAAPSTNIDLMNAPPSPIACASPQRDEEVDEAIEQLTQSMDSASSSNSSSEGDGVIESQRMQIEQLQEDVKAAQMQCDELKVEKDGIVAQSQATQADLNAKLNEAEAMQKETQEDLQRSRDEKMVVEAELERVSNEAEEAARVAMEEQARAQAQINQLRAELDASNQEGERLQAELQGEQARVLELLEQSRLDEDARRKLHNQVQDLRGAVRVYCRVRPRKSGSEEKEDDPVFGSHKEDEMSETLALGYGAPNDKNKRASRKFKLERVFNTDAGQSECFDEISDLVTSSLDGYNVTVFAYGQTGSGKTHTMMGPDEVLRNPDLPERGVIPRAVEQIFEAMQRLKQQKWEYSLQASMLEIYMDDVRDLLSKKNEKIDIRHDNKGQTIVTNLTTVDVDSPAKIFQLLQRSSKQRATAKTDCNARSSRSHSVFRLAISGRNTKSGEVVSSLLNLVDLAGSERLGKSNATGVTRKETQFINKSLSALSTCVHSIANKRDHVNFRDSKLTYLLKNSLGGKAKTLFFINISPEPDSLQETLCTLRFATNLKKCELKRRK